MHPKDLVGSDVERQGVAQLFVPGKLCVSEYSGGSSGCGNGIVIILTLQCGL